MGDKVENIERLIDYSLEAGKIMLESNSEIYRAEDIITNICKSYGVENIDVFTLATCVYLTVTVDGKTYTRVKRIYNRKTDLLKISSINKLSRKIVKECISLEDFHDELVSINNIKGFSNGIRALTMSASCGVFGIMFMPSATILDFLVTFAITYTTYYLMQFLGKYSLNDFISNSVLAAYMTSLAMVAVVFNIASDIDTIVIGTIMILVPGVAVTNAVRDTINGDILSGTIRALEAVIIAFGIAFGVGIILVLANAGGLL